MNKKLLVAGFICFIGLFGCTKFDPAEQGQDENITGSPASRGAMMAAYQGTDHAQEGVVIVKFKRAYLPGTVTMSGDGVARTGVQPVDAVGSRVGAYKIERVFAYAEKFEKKRRRHGLDQWYRVSYDVTRSSLAQVAADYSALQELEWVETARYGELIGDQGGREATESSATRVSPAQASTAPFNDPMLPDQWWIDAKGTTVAGVNPDADINLLPAWEKVRGSREVIVCVVDGCVKWDHADLAANMWANPGEIPGNFIDDDNNGCLDDVWGFDFSQKNDIIQYVPHDHGTHVAGIVAAVNNNGIGVCGVAGGSGYGDGARIMSCQIFNGTMSTYDQMAQAIEYGANMGAVISQNSWGFSSTSDRSEVIRQAIEYFVAEAGDAEMFPNSPMRGGLVFFAAGNEGEKIGQQKLYPQAYEGAIAVSSTDHQRKRSAFSCYGDWVEISAPGGSTGNDQEHHIKSTYAGKSSTYGYFPGTSQACPMVSGVTALLIQANPGKTNAEIRELLLSSVSSLESTEPEFAMMGSGLLNASKHLGAINDNQGPNPVSDLKIVNDIPNKSVTLDWTVPQDPSGDYINTYTLYYSESEITAQNLASASSLVIEEYKRKPAGDKISYSALKINGLNPDKVYYFALTSQDQWGNGSLLSNVVQLAQKDDKKGPLAIADLAVTENVSSRVFSLNWTVPQDQLGDWVQSYTAYYSIQPINALNLMQASNTVFDQFSDLIAGDKITVKFDKLKGLNLQQNNYIVVVSKDRWGNVSPLSNVAMYVAADQMVLISPITAGELVWAVGRNHKSVDKTLRVYDRSGRVVLTRTIPADTTKNTMTVNVSLLASGNYTYRLESDGETVFNGTFRRL